MKAIAISQRREKIVASALLPVASELRLVNPADLIAPLRFESYGDIADLIASSAELYFQPGTVCLGTGGDYVLEWGGHPKVTLDLELRPAGVTVYLRLSLEDANATIEITYITFDDPSANPEENTDFLEKALASAALKADYFSRTLERLE